jgi:enamine deaminase RidA (YjgF/YER057c/UK114 family)
VATSRKIYLWHLARLRTVSQSIKFAAATSLVISNAVRNLRSCRAQLGAALIFLVLPIGSSVAQEKDSIRQSGQPPDVQVVETKDLTVLTLSGVGPQDDEGKLAAPGDFAAQFKQTWDNLRRLMIRAGSPLRNIVSITVYTTEAKWQEPFKELQQESFSDWNLAMSFLVSQQLRTPGALLEIHAVAIIDRRKPIRRQ